MKNIVYGAHDRGIAVDRVVSVDHTSKDWVRLTFTHADGTEDHADVPSHNWRWALELEGPVIPALPGICVVEPCQEMDGSISASRMPVIAWRVNSSGVWPLVPFWDQYGPESNYVIELPDGQICDPEGSLADSVEVFLESERAKIAKRAKVANEKNHLTSGEKGFDSGVTSSPAAVAAPEQS